MKLLIAPILFAIATVDSEPNYEQLAADYYFKRIVSEKYPNLKAAEFATKTDTSLFFGIVMTCKKWDEQIRKEIFSAVPEENVELKIPESDIEVKKFRNNTKRLKVIVSPKRKIGDNYFVEIIAYRKLRFIDYTIFRFDQEGRLVDICERGEII